MATMLSNGSAGEEVKKLQKALQDKGYDLGSYGADGIFGAKTESAVRQYQKDNGLAVDGIAGEKTLGSLYAQPKPATQTTTPASTTQTAAKQQEVQSVPVVSTQTETKEQTKQEPKPETQTTTQTATKEASKEQTQPVVQTVIQTIPVPDLELPVYTPSYEALLSSLEKKLQAGQEFSYRLEDDPLYHQYRKAYLNDGELAAQDSAAKAASATGGYGNSYAQGVSQQALQSYLEKLYALTPQLAANAYDRHNQKQQDLLSYYKTVLSAQDAEYDRYQQALKQYLQVQDTAYERQQDAVALQRQQEQDAYDKEQDALKLQRQQEQDAYDKEQDALKLQRQAEEDAYQKQQNQYKLLQTLVKAGYDPTEEELQAAGMTRAQAQALQPQAKTAASGTGSTSSGTSGYDNGGYTETQIAQLQQFLGVTADGKFGTKSKAAMKEKGYQNLKEAMEAMENQVGYFDYDDATHSQLNAQNNGQSMYSMVLKSLKEMHGRSEPLEKVATYLKEMVGASYITQSEYLRLYNRYRDNRLSEA